MISLRTLKSEFARFLVNQTLGSRIADWAHWVVADILAENDYWWNKKRGTFSTVASQAEYFLDHRVNMKQISGMWDTTNNRIINECSIEDIYDSDPTPTETGTPERWAYIGQSEVQAEKASAAQVTVVSSSAADVSQVLQVRGRVSGIDRYESITLNGTASVNGGPDYDANGVESLVLSTACAGTVTITSGSTTMATIPPGYLRVQVPKIRLSRVPGAVYSMVYIFHQKAVRMVNDNDILDLPDEAFKAVRCGIEEIGHLNNGDMDYSLQAHQKYVAAKEELFRWSNRNLKQTGIKDYQPSAPFGYRLPELVSYTVT